MAREIALVQYQHALGCIWEAGYTCRQRATSAVRGCWHTCLSVLALQGGPMALRMAKQAVNLGLELDLHSGMKLEEACYAQVRTGLLNRLCIPVCLFKLDSELKEARTPCWIPPAPLPYTNLAGHPHQGPAGGPCRICREAARGVSRSNHWEPA